MKATRHFAIILTVLVTHMAHSQQTVSGDIWRWLPFDGGTIGKESQIVRNLQYVSIKVQAAHVSYKSGYLENIKQIVISSSVTFDLNTQKVQALSINRTWHKSKNSDDNIPVNDLLAVLSPASPSSIEIKMSFAGIGEDKFKSVFELLSNNDVKTALNLSPASIAQAGLVTSIAQKFLATPYTSSNPKDVLSLSQGFVIYSNKGADRVDSLRQRYIVVISGSEKKSGDLDKLTNAPADALRFNTTSHLLEIKQSDGTWQSFNGNSYVVLSVTVDSVRGTDETSSWFKKFADADKTTENLLTGDAVDKVKKDALDLWQQGSTLLTADSNYVETERKSIRLKALADIQDDLTKNGAASTDANLSTVVPNVPSNLTEVAKQYDTEVKNANLNGSVMVHLHDSKGNAVPHAQLRITNTTTGQVMTTSTDQAGNGNIQSLKPSTYTIEAINPGFGTSNVPPIKVQPRQTNEINLKVGP
jgi:hypothetical protein